MLGSEALQKCEAFLLEKYSLWGKSTKWTNPVGMYPLCGPIHEVHEPAMFSVEFR
jgi:hypothetical protein